MNTLDDLFITLKSKNESAFMPFVTLGDPNEEITIKIITTLIENGADIIELGIPFSDPMADGPTIQKSYQRSLNAGMNTDKAFELVKKIREFSKIPLIFLTYYNIVLQYPLEEFFKMCKKHQVQGIVIPDLPIEEAEFALQESKKNDVHIIFLIAPNTSEKRISRILEKAGGFLYFVTLFGTTGTRKEINKLTIEHLLKFTAISNLPVLPGFGISTPSHVQELINAGADGVIVGSAVINIIEENIKDIGKMLELLGNFVRSMKKNTIKRGI
ncbi:MAG: tryptophan synthase subunit alpha [Candidatus Lokiarchaeota archaeon]|nr:tryptophan synthase subunit alpha [Candidatus Lokiarchaeota archaeon]